MRKINIREALLRLDKRTDCQYDLTTLYEACDLDEKDKKKLVQYIDGYEDPASISKFLETRCDAVCESIDDDDVSDMKLVDDINNDDDHALWELMNKFEEEDLQPKDLTEDVHPDEKVAIARRIREAATGVLVGKLGYEEDFVDDYMIIDVDDVDDDTRIKVEVRAEVDYDGLMTLGQALNPIVKEYDKNAYFEPVTSGIMSAYIRKDQSDDIPDEAAVKEWTARFNACQTKDDVKAVYRDLIKVRDNNEVTFGTIEAIYDVIDAKMDSLGESLTEDAKEEYFVGDDETGRIYYNEKDAQAAFDGLKKSGIANPVKMKVTDMREDVNDGWVKRWNFLDNYYKDDLVISKISSPANAWHLERVAPNGHTIEHLGNYNSLEAAKAGCTKKNESKLALNESDDTDILYDMEDYDEDNTTVTAGNSFIEDGHEWTWFKQCGESVHLDFDNWAVWWAFRPEIDGDENSTAISGFFIVDTDTGFIDWGPCDTVKEAQEFLQSKVNDWENDDLSESKPIMEELWDRARVIDLVNYYLDRSNVTTNTLANLVMKQMKKEGSSLPSNITDFYDSLYNAIDMYNEQFDESLHPKVIKEDALDDFGVSKSDAATISVRLPKSKFYIDNNRYVFGRDLLDYFDENEVISYSQYVNVNNVRVPDSYRIHDRTITESGAIEKDANENIRAVADRLFDVLQEYGARRITKYFDTYKIYWLTVEDDGVATLVNYAILEQGFKEVAQYGNEPNVTDYINEAGDINVKLLIYNETLSVEISREDASQYNESIKEGVEKYIIRATEDGLNLYYNSKEDHMSTDMNEATIYSEREIALDDYKAVKERYPNAYIRSIKDLDESYDDEWSDEELAAIFGGDTKYDMPDGIETPAETEARLAKERNNEI